MTITTTTPTIEGVLEGFDLPLSLLHEQQAPIIVGGEWWSKNTSLPWVHDGRLTPIPGSGLGADGAFILTGASHAIRVDIGPDYVGGPVRQIGRVVVWPGCKLADLADTLASLVYGRGADADYVQAVRRLDAARSWISNYEIQPGQTGEVLTVNGRDFRLYPERGETSWPHLMGVLLEKHGLELFRAYFGGEQIALLVALSNEEEGARYVRLPLKWTHSLD